MKLHSGPFLFASPDGKAPSTARKVHVRRLLDILHLSIQRGDLRLARRAFGLLARCEEIEWLVIWKIGLVILAAANSPPSDILGTTKHIEFLRVMMLQNPEEVRASHLLVSFSFQAQRPSTPNTNRTCPTHRLCVSARIAPSGASVIPSAGWTGA
jgi:hypothetical protein